MFKFKDEIIQNVKNKYEISDLTKNVCLYPNRYLDNDNTCVSCNLYEHCGCGLKNLGKKRKIS